MADNEVRNMKKTGTGKSAIGLVLVGIGIVALIGLIIWFLTVPGVLESLLFIALAIVVIVAIVVSPVRIVATVVIAVSPVPSAVSVRTMNTATRRPTVSLATSAMPSTTWTSNIRV